MHPNQQETKYLYPCENKIPVRTANSEMMTRERPAMGPSCFLPGTGAGRMPGEIPTSGVGSSLGQQLPAGGLIPATAMQKWSKDVIP